MSIGRGRGQGRGNKRGRGRSQNRGGRNSPANTQGRGSNLNQNQGQDNNQQSGQHHAQGQRKAWVYSLKNKSEVFENFRNFKALVENQSGLHIKVLRTGRGGGHISKEFLHFCRENGIHKQFTTRYTPQQNGVAERKNRTIMDMARSMLKAKHLPNDYWA
eukprot:PITA_17159